MMSMGAMRAKPPKSAILRFCSYRSLSCFLFIFFYPSWVYILQEGLKYILNFTRMPRFIAFVLSYVCGMGLARKVAGPQISFSLPKHLRRAAYPALVLPRLLVPSAIQSRVHSSPQSFHKRLLFLLHTEDRNPQRRKAGLNWVEASLGCADRI
jgi:hypothetical protein